MWLAGTWRAPRDIQGTIARCAKHPVVRPISGKRAKRVLKRGVGAGRSAQRGTSATTTGPRGAAGPHNPSELIFHASLGSLYTFALPFHCTWCVPERSAGDALCVRFPRLTGLGVELGDRATRPSPQTVQTARHWSLAHRDASIASD